jgi:MSHA biogenesis protein MshJ
MKRLWQQYVTKMEAASLRERVLIFAAAAVAMIALLSGVLIEPEHAKQRRLTREVEQRQGEIRKVQDQLQKMQLARQSDPDQGMRKQLEALRARTAQAEAKLKEEQRKFVPPERIGALLEEMLVRNRRLQLVDMRTLPVSALDSAAPGQNPPAQKPSAEKPAAPKPGPAGTIYRHGVEITLTGGYLDLLAYLRDLEKQQSQMYWGRLDLSVGTYPTATLKLSVYTMSLDLAWLIV